MRRLLLPSALLLALASLGATCTGSGPQVVAPAEGERITTSSFEVRIALPADAFDLSTLEARLNGTLLPLTGGPTEFVVALEPGPPLSDHNELVVKASPPDSPVVFQARRSFDYAPPRALARRITSPDDRVQGPLAHSRVGDWLLENDVARFVIQDAPQRDLYAVGQFGGNLIDAELRARPGLDNFMELQPGVNIETVLNAQTVEIVNDGLDGRPAVVRSCGPDDTLDFMNISTNVEEMGLALPPGVDDFDYPVEGCTEYALAPGDTWVTIRTTLVNLGEAQIGLGVGDFINASGEVDQWMNAGAGIGEILTGSLDTAGWIGYGHASGVDYHLVPIPLPGTPFPRSDFVATAGTTVILHSFSLVAAVLGVPPVFVLPPQGANTFTRLFGVGDGSGGNGVALALEAKGVATGTIEGCVTLGGAPATGARVAVGPQQAGVLRGLVSHFVTDEAGCYRGVLPPGSYGVAAARPATPYQGGLATPTANPVTIVAGQTTVQDVALPTTGRVAVTVRDAAGLPVPARISVVGIDASPHQRIHVPGILGTPGADTSPFQDVTADGVPFGLVALAYAGADGAAAFDVEPGSYRLYVSRGTEWSLFETPLEVTAGAPVAVEARIARVLDTAGFLSSDYHVHGIASADSRVARDDRVRQFAGEGVDNVIMTDHHVHTDLGPTIAALGMTPFVNATVGEEITCWDCGHFNGYPFLVDPDRVSGGSTDWAREAPPGQDFKQYGAYIRTPAEIHALATTGATATPETVVQVNHIDSHFLPLEIDTADIPPQSHIGPEEKLRLRLDPASGNLFHPFPAIEVWNSASRGGQRQFLDERMGIWFNLLNQGIPTTAIADTDTHDYLNLNSAGARTWTAAVDDAPAALDPQELGAAVKAGRAVGGQGLYVQAALRADDGSNGRATFEAGGVTQVASANGAVILDVAVQAPLWAEFDTIEIYANADTVATGHRNGTPVLYTGVPERVLQAGADFTVDVVEVAPDVPGGSRREAHVSLQYALERDTWFVVVARGSDGVSRPMFPVYPKDLQRQGNDTTAALADGNLGESGVLALGFTNALYADVDGQPGFDPPRTASAE